MHILKQACCAHCLGFNKASCLPSHYLLLHSVSERNLFSPGLYNRSHGVCLKHPCLVVVDCYRKVHCYRDQQICYLNIQTPMIKKKTANWAWACLFLAKNLDCWSWISVNDGIRQAIYFKTISQVEVPFLKGRHPSKVKQICYSSMLRDKRPA